MTYEIVFTGELRRGFSRRQGIDTLCQKFSLNFEQAKSLLSGSRRVVKRVADPRRAEKVIRALWQGGWHSELRLNSRVIFSTKKPKRTPESPAQDTVRYRSAGGEISVRLPNSWRPCEGLNHQAILQAGDAGSHHYIAILKQPRHELPPELTLLEYGAAQLQQCLAKVDSGSVLSEPRVLVQGHRTCCTSEMSAELDGTAIQYLIAQFHCPRYFYTIFLWCDRRQYAKAKEKFDRIVASFAVESEVEAREDDRTIVQKKIAEPCC